MSLLPAQPVLKSSADLVAQALRRSLEDLECQITTVRVAEIYGKPVYIIEVTLPGGPTLSFAPREIDNGAGGIEDDTLVQIRRAAGQVIAYRPRPLDRPGKYFTDIISLDDPDDPES